MPDNKDLERRVAKLEGRITEIVRDLNAVNQKTYKHVTLLESRVTGVVKGLNQVNQKTFDHVTKLEKRFFKFDKWQKKTGKFANPKVQQKQTMKLVDAALKAYDQKKGSKT